MDELQELINEWWGLLVQEHTDTRPPAHNLFWWIEGWMGDDLGSVTNGIEEATQERQWTYRLTEPEYPHCMFSHRDRHIALMKAAIALAKRRAGHDQT